MSTAFILRFSALGDVAMTIPIVYGVADANPDICFIYFTGKRFSELFIDSPKNLEVVSLDSIHTGSVFRHMKKEIDILNPIFVADLHNVGRTWLVDAYAMLKGIKVVMVNKSRISRRYCLTHKIGQTSYADRYFNVFHKLGVLNNDQIRPVRVNPGAPPIHITRPAIGIAPFARYDTKIYPTSMTEEVISILTSQNINVYLFGGHGEEQKLLESWASKFPNCTSVAGKFSLSKEMAIMASLQVLLSMDSANQHIGSLVGTKVITVWGATAPICGFTPYMQSPNLSILSRIDCQPCSIAGSPKCPRNDFRCMNSIQPMKIAKKIINELY